MNTLAKDIYWTGSIDWDLREFHGYSTKHGSTYNAYLIVDEKPTLIDTVKHCGVEEMISRIREIIDPAKIAYIISNHTEMDHSGSIDTLLDLCPNATVVCSPKGEEGLKRHFLPAGRQGKKDWKFKVVTTGDTLNIGKRDLVFQLMPMVHWPDSMATYSPSDKILFPNDAFGQHYASEERFADEVGIDIILKEAAKYYANIVLPYGAQVLKVLEAVSALEIELIAPSHGLLWRRKEDIANIISRYQKWARYESDKKVAIVYDTMWHSTETMAHRLYSACEREHIPALLLNLKTNDISDVITEIMHARVVLFGSSILNGKVLPPMGGFLTYLRGLKPKNKKGFTFGSYGWSRPSFKEFETWVAEAGVEPIREGFYTQFVPAEDELLQLEKVVSEIKEVLSQ